MSTRTAQITVRLERRTRSGRETLGVFVDLPNGETLGLQRWVTELMPEAEQLAVMFRDIVNMAVAGGPSYAEQIASAVIDHARAS